MPAEEPLDALMIESFAATVAIAAIIGGFFDFYVGKNGQKLVRNWMESLWIRLSYMTLSDVARVESLLAGRVISKVFGTRLFSLKRVLLFTTLFLLLLVVALSSSALRTGSVRSVDYLGPYFGVPISAYVTYLIRTSISISVSISIAQRIASTTFQSMWLGASSILVLLSTQILVTLSPYAVRANAPGGWQTPLHQQLKLSLARFYPFEYNAAVPEPINYFVDLLLIPMTMVWGMFLAATDTGGWYELPRCGYLTDVRFTPFVFWSSGLALECAEFWINLIRLTLFFIFALTFALFPFRKVFSTVCARVIESDKPVFTLTLAGAAALSKLVQELAKLL